MQNIRWLTVSTAQFARFCVNRRMNRIFSFTLFLFTLTQLQGQAGLDQILKRSVSKQGIDYKHLKLNETSFVEAVDAYLVPEIMVQAIEAEVAANINAYNLIVLREITKQYPISSVKEDARFFDKKHMIFGEEKSLNEIEKHILHLKKDARIHFLLVCGAKSCPSLAAELIHMGNLEEKLEEATSLAMATPHMLMIDDEKKEIKTNAIFSWFADDFDDPKRFINRYFTQKDLSDYKLSLLRYDWTLNSIDPVPVNKRYLATRLYNKGEFEVHIFNNYYTQKETGTYENFNFGRHNFFTILSAVTVGINNRLNIGLGARTRSVYQDRLSTDGVFKALSFGENLVRTDIEGRNAGYTRTGLTAIYPFVKYAPFASHSNISITHTLFVPTGDDLEGRNGGGYIDWDNISFNNQLFYTKSLGLKKELFIDAGFLIENLGTHVFTNSDSGGFTQFGFPLTAILNVFPKSGVTYYGLISAAPRITVSSSNGNRSIDSNAYAQGGAGFKYFLTSNLEVETLYTLFLDTTDNRIAHTFNLGLRYFNR